jgi:hypothetical protein
MACQLSGVRSRLRAPKEEKGPAIKGSDAGPENAHAGEAGMGTRSGRKAGDVHRPTNVTAGQYASSVIG